MSQGIIGQLNYLNKKIKQIECVQSSLDLEGIQETLEDINIAINNANDIIGSVIKPFVFIAASNAALKERERADYVCDGVDDHIQIQAALDGFGSVGGTVMLSAGTFNVDAIYPPNYTSILGQGMGITILKGQVTNTTKSVFHRTHTNSEEYAHLQTSKTNPVKGVIIKDLEIDGSLMPIANAKKISSIVGDGTNATVTTEIEHGLVTNDYVLILDSNIFLTQKKYKTVKVTVIDSTSFTFPSTIVATETNVGQVIKPFHNNGGAKALFFMWLQDCTFENLYAHHTPSTVFGSDNHQNCKYINCRAEFGGRSAKLEKNGLGETMNRPSGCSGFGLGVSGFEEENLQVIGCTAKYNWNSGFVFETVNDAENDVTTSYLRFESCLGFGNTYNFKVEDGTSRQSQGTIFSNCYAREAVANMVTTYSQPNGVLMASGGTGFELMSNVNTVSVINSISCYNDLYGMENDGAFGRNITFSGNHIFGNKGMGIFVRGSGIIIKGNQIVNNGTYGIRVRAAGQPIRNITIEGNHIMNNGRDLATEDTGIDIQNETLALDGLMIVNNRIGNVPLSSSFTSISGNGTTVTVSTMPGVHGLFTGDKINITGTTAFNGTGKVVTVINPNKFTYSDTVIGNEVSGTLTRINSQDYPIVIRDEAVVTNVLVANNIMTGNLRAMASTYVNAGVTKVNNIG